jgi:hypothetical protein
VSEARERRHLQRGQYHDDSDREREHDTDLHEGGQIVARGEQQPNRQHGRGEAIHHYGEGKRLPRERRVRGEIGVGGHPSAGVKCPDEEHESHRARLEHAPWTKPAQVHAHEQRDRNREPDRDHSPWARGECVHDHEREHGDEHDHDSEDRDERSRPRHRPDLVSRHRAERAAVAAHGREQDDEILYGAAEHYTGDDPDRAGEESELCRERRSNQRPWARDRCEMMPEHDPSIGREIVATVLHPNGGRGATVIDGEDLRGDEATIEAVPNRVTAERCREQPAGADGLSAREGETCERGGAKRRDGDPEENRERATHRRGKMHTKERAGPDARRECQECRRATPARL